MRDNLIEMSRADLDAMARAAWAVVDNPDGFTPEQLDANDQLLDDLTMVICYGPEYYGRLVPCGFHPLWGGFFTLMLEEFLMDLGEEVCEAHPTLVVVARQAAKACDYQGYGTDYRLDMLQNLNKILASLWEFKDEIVVDDELADRVKRRIDMRCFGKEVGLSDG
jgi:hypothetical protein